MIHLNFRQYEEGQRIGHLKCRDKKTMMRILDYITCEITNDSSHNLRLYFKGSKRLAEMKW